jgi:hypothetical protein
MMVRAARLSSKNANKRKAPMNPEPFFAWRPPPREVAERQRRTEPSEGDAGHPDDG